jgi:hypothetical protein
VPDTRLRSPAAQALGPVLAGLAFLLVLGVGLWGCAAWVTHTSGDDSRLHVNLGDDLFNLGKADRRASDVRERGPLLFPGLLGKDRGYIVVTHAGSNPLKGWHAFDAVPAGEPVTCAVSWIAERAQLVDPCHGTAYPLDGTGLTTYEVFINPNKEVVIDLTPGGAPGQGPSTVPTTSP